MSDPGSYLTVKIAAAIGGFLGGAAILTFIRPKTIGEAFWRGSVSTGTAIIFTAPIVTMLGMDTTWETQMMIGFCVGFVAYSILGMVARFFQRTAGDDIVSVAGGVKNKMIDGPAAETHVHIHTSPDDRTT